ncbi:MAG: alanine racemase [Candidatus Goldiibacteriota bacterium]
MPRELFKKTNTAAAEIDLAALKYNFTALKRKTKKKIIPVIKANAYGHGIVEISRFLEKECGADILAAARMSEGIQLRKNGIKTGILILNGAGKDEISDAVRNNLAVSVHCAEKLKDVSAFCAKNRKKADIHLKFNTGMNRLGISLTDALRVKKTVDMNPRIRLKGIYTHFADADKKNDTRTLKQARELEKLKKIFGDGPMYHAANSAAAARYESVRFDAVRPGIMLYGCYPGGGFRFDIKLKPVMSLSAPVIQVRKIKKGDKVSYGGKYTAPSVRTIAVVGIGYGDGFFRSLSNKGYVLIKGKKAPVLGAVCMDMTAVRAPEKTKNGDRAVVFGKSGKAVISVEQIAEKAGTIPYEILTGITDRVERVYR